MSKICKKEGFLQKKLAFKQNLVFWTYDGESEMACVKESLTMRTATMMEAIAALKKRPVTIAMTDTVAVMS